MASKASMTHSSQIALASRTKITRTSSGDLPQNPQQVMARAASSSVLLPHCLPRGPLHRVPGRSLPSGAGRARRTMLHAGRVEGGVPAALVVARELEVEAL